MDIVNYIDGAVGISPLEGEMAGRPEGVVSREARPPTVDRRLRQDGPTASVAFGDISPKGEITPPASHTLPAAYSSATTPLLNCTVEIGSNATGISGGNSFLPSPTEPG